jgi:transposase-like protein
VVAVARSSGLTRARVARDFGVSENTVARCVKQANIDIEGRAAPQCSFSLSLSISTR